VSLDSAGVEVSELEAGWRILVGKEFKTKGAAELKERLPVSSLTGAQLAPTIVQTVPTPVP